MKKIEITTHTQMLNKVYLAGGLRSDWRKEVMNACGNFIYFNPQGHNLEYDHNLYTVWDLHFIKHCDILFAFMEATNPSGYGLSLEIGFAKALNKTIILVDEKSDNDKMFERYFKFIRKSSDVVVNNLEDGIKYLHSFQ
jgi:nucleoside 2-deoxyribosyltransferase